MSGLEQHQAALQKIFLTAYEDMSLFGAAAQKLGMTIRMYGNIDKSYSTISYAVNFKHPGKDWYHILLKLYVTFMAKKILSRVIATAQEIKQESQAQLDV